MLLCKINPIQLRSTYLLYEKLAKRSISIELCPGSRPCTLDPTPKDLRTASFAVYKVYYEVAVQRRCNQIICMSSQHQVIFNVPGDPAVSHKAVSETSKHCNTCWVWDDNFLIMGSVVHVPGGRPGGDVRKAAS